MAWYVYLAYFGAGLFLANGLRHFINGISGKRFQSSFASPPGVGESSPLVNVIWGIVNLAIGYCLIHVTGDFSCGLTVDALLVGLGVVICSMALALHFGRVRGDKKPSCELESTARACR